MLTRYDTPPTIDREVDRDLIAQINEIADPAQLESPQPRETAPRESARRSFMQRFVLPLQLGWRH